MNRSSKAFLLTSLYLAQGLPYGFFTQALPVLLRKASLSLPLIGAANLLTLPWALKFLWAPAMDRIEYRSSGLRRTWLIPLQAACVALYGVLASLSLEQNLTLVLAAFLFTNLLSASQDIATDGLAVDILDANERGWANGIQVAGYRIGMIIGGGALLAVYDTIGWRGEMLAMAGITALCTWPVWIYREPRRDRKPVNPRSIRQLFREMFHYFTVPGSILWGALLLLYKFGHASVTSMLRPWLVDRGYSLADIGWILGGGGFVPGFLGAIVGGWIASRFAASRLKLLILFSALELGTVTLYLWPLRTELAAYKVLIAASLDHFMSGVATVTLFACMMDTCSKERAASDYTIQACVVVISQTIAGLVGGLLAETIGYSGQFLFSSFIGAAALVLTVLAQKRLRETLFKFAAHGAAAALICGVCLFVSSESRAQQRQAPQAQPYKETPAIGIHAGPLLPKRMGILEILKGWGLRGTLPTRRGTFEIDTFFAHTEGTTFDSIALDYKFNIANDVMPAHFILGLHTDWYTPPQSTARFSGGWHYGGGFSVPVSERVSLRGDFKYNFSPGQSLYVGVGIEVKFPDETGS